MATKSKNVTKKPKRPKTAAVSNTPNVRRLKTPKYKSFRPSKRIKNIYPPLPGAPRLFVRSIKFILQNKKLFVGIMAVYLLLTVVLVRSVSSGADLTELKQVAQQYFTGDSSVQTGFRLFGVLLGNGTGPSSDVGSAYQTLLLIMISVVLIWSFRQVHAGIRIGVRDAFYKSLFPFIPFVLVLLVIGLQLLPFTLGAYLYATVVGGGLAVTMLEKMLWSSMSILLLLLSFYMVTSSIFALYIVTLPDVRPMQALRSARELVRFRRWQILRKVAFLPLVLLVIGLVILVPIIILLTPLAETVYLVLLMMALVIAHSYMYTLYRELL